MVLAIVTYTLLSEVCSSGNTMYAALLARRQAAAKLGGPNWEAKLDGDSDVMEVGGGGGGVDRNSVFQSARFQALVSCYFKDSITKCTSSLLGDKKRFWGGRGNIFPN